MKNTNIYQYFLSLFILSFELFAVEFQTCGKHPLEFDDPDKNLRWITALNLKYSSLFYTASGIVCAGISEDFSTGIEKIVYRGSRKYVDRKYSNTVLKNPQVLLKSSDFPGYFAFFLKRNEVYVTLQLLEEDKGKKLSIYQLVFLRNLGGWKANDYRYIDLYVFRNSDDKSIKITIDDTGIIEFNTIVFEISVFGSHILSLELLQYGMSTKKFNIEKDLNKIEIKN